MSARKGFLAAALLGGLLLIASSAVALRAQTEIEDGGNCKNDCGCNGGNRGCCVLPNGAICLMT